MAALAFAFAAPPTALTAQSAAYLDFDDLTDELRSVVNGSDLASMRSLGTSHQGREIWLVTLADPAGPPVDERPAVLVVGNLSGDHLVGSQLALEAVRYLVGEGAVDADLAQHVIYVVPRLNPDGAERMFSGPDDGWGRSALPFDDDLDGRIDEDGPEDLNGDGAVTVMRVADAGGMYMVHPDEPRLMKRADAAQAETGTHSLHLEGLDNDGDGYINEDGPGGVDLDRHFQHAYPYWERDAGPNMVSEPEARALMDFVIGARNIAAVLTFGHTDNLVSPPTASGALAGAATLDLNDLATAANDDLWDVGVYGVPFQPGGLDLRGAQPGRDNDPSSGRRPSTTVHNADREYFGAVSEAYREITGIEQVGVNKEAEGAFFQYGYFHYGVPSFSTQGWALPEGEATAGTGTDGEVLAGLGDAFVDWTTYEHPDLGTVEIGGFKHMDVTNPPAADLPELGMKHGQFVARLSGMLPRVRITDTQVVAHGGGVFTVTAEVANTGYFPSALQHGVISRAVQPVTVQIQVDADQVLTGASKTTQIQQLEGSGARERISWVIQASPGASVEIRVRAQKGGTDSATVTLR